MDFTGTKLAASSETVKSTCSYFRISIVRS